LEQISIGTNFRMEQSSKMKRILNLNKFYVGTNFYLKEFKMEQILFQRIIRTNIKSEQIYIGKNFYWNKFQNGTNFYWKESKWSKFRFNELLE
jgi:hypothetical protein